MGFNVEEYELWEGDKKLCDVVEFDHDSTCVVKWLGDIKSIIIYDRLADFVKISVNNKRVLKVYQHRCSQSHDFVDSGLH